MQWKYKSRRTFNLSNGTGQNFFLSPLILNGLEHVLDDGLGQSSLLVLLCLLLVSDPAVKDSLNF